MKRQYVEGMIATYGGRSPAAEQECEKLRQALKKNRIPPRYHQTEDLLKALIFIENNREDLYLREVSSLIYGDSKYLEEKVLGPYAGHFGLTGDVLAARWRWKMKFWKNIILHREKQKLCLKGDVTVRISGKELELGLLPNGMELFVDELHKIQQIQVHGTVFTTVENYTSWLRCRSSKEAFFYLGGYATRYQRDFLKKIYSDNPAPCLSPFRRYRRRGSLYPRTFGAV